MTHRPDVNAPSREMGGCAAVDEALVAACEPLLTGLYETAASCCRRYGVPVSLAEDFVHESFIKVAYERPGRARPDQPVRFLRATIRRRVINWARGAWHALTRVHEPAPEDDLADSMLDALHDQEDVRRALDELDEGDREILRLVYYRELDIHQLAKRLCRTERWALERHRRALERFARVMRRRAR